MPITDFGNIKGVVESVQSAAASRSTGPVYDGTTTVANQFLGDAYLSNIRKNVIFGTGNEFMWGEDRWADAIHKVE